MARTDLMDMADIRMGHTDGTSADGAWELVDHDAFQWRRHVPVVGPRAWEMVQVSRFPDGRAFAHGMVVDLDAYPGGYLDLVDAAYHDPGEYVPDEVLAEEVFETECGLGEETVFPGPAEAAAWLDRRYLGGGHADSYPTSRRSPAVMPDVPVPDVVARGHEEDPTR